MSRLRHGVGSAVLFIFLGGSFSPLQADGQGFTPINVSNRDGRIVVSTSLEGGFPPPIAEELKAGIPREFFYYTVLYRVIPRWYDEEKASKTVRFTVKYDLLKKQFRVIRDDGSEVSEKVFDTYAEMERWVSTLSDLSLSPVHLISKRHRYYVSVKTEMKAGEPPTILKYVLFFVPYSKFSTPWVQSPVFHAADLKP
ncbi:MAG: DUF4390 domain-containing protein [Nitrospirae bacterium]|nr:DUF4390 domain-containing protein [Nitrospirota bacterium]